LGYYAAAGLTLGLALQMYYVSRLVPLVLLALLLHRLIAERTKIIRSLRAGLIVFAVGTLMAFLPIGLFALQRPDEYNSRTNDVSIFSPVNGVNDPDAVRYNLQHNIEKHALM